MCLFQSDVSVSESDIPVIQVLVSSHLIPCADLMGARNLKGELQMESSLTIAAKTTLKRQKRLVR